MNDFQVKRIRKMKKVRELCLFFYEEINKHLILFLFVIGAISYALGVILDGTSLPHFLSDSLKSFSKILIGAGVFTGLTKSSYYTSFFQSRIFNVFYKPGEHFTQEEIKNKWMVLTEHLLEKKAKKSKGMVSNILYNRFLSQDSGFYYRNMNITYDITLLPGGDDLEVRQTMSAQIIFSEGQDEIVLPHKVENNGSMELKHIIVDDEMLVLDEHYVPNETNPNLKTLNITIKNPNRPVNFERCYTSMQKMTDEPFIMSSYARYVNGLVMRFKTKNCKATFRITGVTTQPEFSSDMEIEGNGYTRVVISRQEDLTLPGQGFILIMSK